MPVQWLKHLRTKAGKPYTIAAILLADIVYWYRPIYPKDETTGEVSSPRKKFKADKLQRSYGYYVELYGFSKKQVREACCYLRDQGLINLDFRTVEYKSRQGTHRANNVLYIGLNWRAVQRISYDIQKSEPPIDEKGNRVLPEKEIGYSPFGKEALSQKGDTNTETTSQTTPEISNSVGERISPSNTTIKAIKIYKDLTGIKKLLPAQEQDFDRFVSVMTSYQGEFCLEQWDATVRNAILSGCSPKNLEALFNTHWYGEGNYGKWQQIRTTLGADSDPEYLRWIADDKPPWQELFEE